MASPSQPQQVIDLEAFRMFQKKTNYMFQCYRRGEEMFHPHPNADPWFEKQPHPAVNRRSEVKHGVYSARSELPKYRGARYRVAKHCKLQNVPTRNQSEIIEKMNSVARRLFSVGVRYRSLLAFGGMGLVALFEVRNKTTNLYNKCVAKIGLNSALDTQLAAEKKKMKLMVGAPHIVQVQTVGQLRELSGGHASEQVGDEMPDEPPRHPERLDKVLQSAFSRNNEILLLEHLPHGSLDHWIAKAVELNLKFTDEAAWRMLHCLAKACLAMKYPPACLNDKTLPVEEELSRYVPQQRSTSDNDNDSEAREDVNTDPAAPEAGARSIIHMDLDPTNILVDGSELGAAAGGPHARVPRLKVSDFGLAIEQREVADSMVNVWDIRRRGKRQHYLPEQWTAEWEAARDHPVHEGADIAGQFSERSNIYHVGSILLAVLLRMDPESAPIIAEMTVRNWEHPAYPDGMKDVIDPYEFKCRFGPNGGRKMQTMAWPLAQAPLFGRHEWRLRELIMRCTAYKPYNRPSAGELLRLVEARIAEGFAPVNSASDTNATDTLATLFSAVNMPQEPMPVRAYKDKRGALDTDPVLDDQAAADVQQLDTASSGSFEKGWSSL